MRIAVIPARGGSQRIPRKNINPFYGKPMLAYPIKTAFRSDLFDVVFVSTEDPEIAKVAKRYGAAVVPRPSNLAEINAPDCGTQEVTRHAIEWVNANYVNKVTYACCIYPCTPMLLPEDLNVAWQVLDGHTYAGLYFYVPGMFYWGEAKSFLHGIPLEEGYEIPFPPERYIDINEPSDWLKAEQMYEALMATEP